VANITETIANFVNRTNFESLPQQAIKLAKEAMLDYIAVTIAGSGEPVAQILTNYVNLMKSSEEATVICQELQTTALSAAFLNGTIGHALDYDDALPASVGCNVHLSVCIFPAVIALAEKNHLSGRDLLAAYIVGLEVGYRVTFVIGPYLTDSGWHPTPILGTIAAAAAAANVLKLSADETKTAIGIASSLAGGLQKNFGTMTKPLHAGNAARNGVLSAELAMSGFTGNPSVLEGTFNFCEVFSAKKVSHYQIDCSDLGQEWNLLSLGLSFKPYPCCRAIHPAIDATLNLVQEHNINADEVDHIKCEVTPTVANLASFDIPKNGYEGKFSLRYCIALAVTKRSVTLSDFYDELITDPLLQRIMKKIFVYPYEEQVETKFSLKTKVSIWLRMGKHYSYEVITPKGEGDNPMTTDDLITKFKHCADLQMEKSEIEDLLDTVNHIEEADDIGLLMTKLKKRKSKL